MNPLMRMVTHPGSAPKAPPTRVARQLAMAQAAVALRRRIRAEAAKYTARYGASDLACGWAGVALTSALAGASVGTVSRDDVREAAIVYRELRRRAGLSRRTVIVEPVSGAEALGRWRGRALVYVTPDQFRRNGWL